MRIAVPAAMLVGLLLLLPLHLETGKAESQNTPSTAEQVQPDTMITGRLDQDVVPVNWYKVSATMGKAFNVTLYTEDWPALDTSLEVYDRANAIQGFSRSPFRYESVIMLTPYTGDYYIRVYVEPGNGSGRYSFIVRIQEPFDAAPGGTYDGALDNSTNHPADFYRIFLHAGDIVSANMSETPMVPGDEVSLDIYLWELWPSGGFCACLDVSWWSDPLEHVEGKAPHDGYYYVEATAYNGSGWYKLTVNVTPGQPDAFAFPPDTRNVFSRATFNGTLDQAMHHYAWFKLNVSFATGQQLDVRVRLREGWNEGRFQLTLLDAELGVLGSWRNNEGTMSDSIDLNAVIQNEGTYYVMLMATWGLRSGQPDNLSDVSANASYFISFDLPREDRSPFVAHPLLALGTDENVPLTGIRLDGVFDDPDIPEGDTLRFSATGSQHLEVTLGNSSEVVITPAPHWSGSEQVAFGAVDSLGASAGLSVGITVKAVNDPPFVAREPGNFTFTEGQNYTGFLNLSEVFGDPDLPYGDRLNFTWSSSPLSLYITPPGFLSNGTTLSSGPVPGVPGKYLIIFRARDIDGLEAISYINITVVRLPHPPVALAPSLPLEMYENTEKVGPAVADLFYEPDGEPLTLKFRSLGNITVGVGEDGFLRLDPAPDWSGTEQIYIEAWDTENLSASMTLNVTVRHVVVPPRILDFYPFGDLSVQDGSDVVLRITVYDSDYPLNLTYQWTVDGRTVPSSSVKGNLLALRSVGPGDHLITVTVADPQGLNASHGWAVSIAAKPPAPAVNITVAQTSGGAVAAVGIGAWLLIILGLTENGKYGLFKFLVVPLYTKIRREEVLDHFTRGRIYGMIESSPGVHYTLIKKKVGVGNGTLTYHLSTLEREGFIRSEWDGLYKRFYPAQMASVPGEAVLELSSVQNELLGHIRASPGISQKEISDLTGFSKRVISYHIGQMAQARVIRVERDGKKVRCFSAERNS